MDLNPLTIKQTNKHQRKGGMNAPKQEQVTPLPLPLVLSAQKHSKTNNPHHPHPRPHPLPSRPTQEILHLNRRLPPLSPLVAPLLPALHHPHPTRSRHERRHRHAGARAHPRARIRSRARRDARRRPLRADEADVEAFPAGLYARSVWGRLEPPWAG